MGVGLNFTAEERSELRTALRMAALDHMPNQIRAIIASAYAKLAEEDGLPNAINSVAPYRSGPRSIGDIAQSVIATTARELDRELRETEQAIDGLEIRSARLSVDYRKPGSRR